MAIETLLASQLAADELGYGITPPDVQVHELGEVLLGGEQYPAFRAHTGPRDLIGKGGIRMASYAGVEAGKNIAGELSAEMMAKLALRGYADTYKGGKGLIMVDPRSLSHEARKSAARQFEGLMEDAGLAGYSVDVPAGDVGTNGLAGEYALERQRRHQNDDLWRASVTGKPPELGGLEFRTAATGWGAYVAHRSLMEARHLQHATANVQGFGNVGAWYAYFANEDQDKFVTIAAISEYNATLSTEDPAGLKITREMVDLIGDNPEFKGDKLTALAQMLEHNQPGINLRLSANPNDILTLPADYFVPAALGNVITDDNVATLGATKGIIEAANGPTMLEAHRYLVATGRDILPDTVVNGAGVDCSIMEHQANIKGLVLETGQVRSDLTRTTLGLMADVLMAAHNLDTPDLRLAATALSNVRIDEDPYRLRQLVG